MRSVPVKAQPRQAEPLPEEPTPWLEWGRWLEGREAIEEAEARYREAARRAPADPRPALALGRLLLTAGEPVLARPHLQRAADLGRGTAIGAEAEKLLQSLGKEGGVEGDLESGGR